MKKDFNKQALCTWLSSTLDANHATIAYKLITFDLLFKWYARFDENVASCGTQFARCLSVLSKERTEYNKQVIRDKTKGHKRIHYFLFLPITQNNQSPNQNNNIQLT